MKKIYALLSPGEFVARHVNQNYADFSRQAKHEIKKGNRKLIWYAKIFPLCPPLRLTFWSLRIYDLKSLAAP